MDSCLLHLPLPPNFPLFLSSLAGWRGCMMKREIPNKSDLHSATVMICVDWPHSARCKKTLQLFTRSRKQGWFGLSDPHLPPQAAGRLLKSALREPVLPLPSTRGPDQVVRRSKLPPAGRTPSPRRETGAQPAFGKLIIRGRGRGATDTSENEILRARVCSAFTCSDGFGGCFDPWPSLSNKYHRSRGNTIIRSRQARPFVGEFVADD